MLDAVTNAIEAVLDWVALFLTSLTESTGELYPLLTLFAIGVAVSAILLGIKIVKTVVWGS